MRPLRLAQAISLPSGTGVVSSRRIISVPSRRTSRSAMSDS